MVAVTVAIIALAAPTGGLSVGLAAALSVSTAVASAIITVGLTVAASLAFRALGTGAPRPTSQTGPPQVFRQSLANSFIVYGKRRVGGLMVFFHGTQSGDDHFRYFVIACAGHHCNARTKWFLNDEEVTVNGSNMVTTGDYANAAWLWFQEGNASETANATFVSECGGKWTSAHKGNGVAAIYAKFQMTEDVVQAGMPNITAEVEGKDDIADPTGGSAGYTNLASRVFYDWMALPREEGGFGAYADEIPDDAYMAAQSNVCDETVDGEDRYTINAVITTGAPPAEIRDVMVVNCAGSYTYSGGKHLMRPGYWVPVTESLSEDDLAGPIQVSAFLPGDQAATEVQGTYVEPTNGYQGMPFATQSVAATDVRQMDLDLAFTTSKHQAERIAKIMLNRAQCEKSVVWSMNIEGLKVKALDTVQLDTSRYGLSNYAFQVLNWGLAADWGVVLTLREENEDIYDPPSPVAAPTVPAITVPPPLGGPADTTGLGYTGDLGADVQTAFDELEARTTFRGACAKKSVNQASANYTAGAAIAFDEDLYDTDAIHDISTNNSRLTVPTGVTRVKMEGQIGIQAQLDAGQWARSWITKNNASDYDGDAFVTGYADVAGSLYMNLATPEIAVTAGDYFDLWLVVESDTTITLHEARTWFAMRIIE